MKIAMFGLMQSLLKSKINVFKGNLCQTKHLASLGKYHFNAITASFDLEAASRFKFIKANNRQYLIIVAFGTLQTSRKSEL